MTQRHTRGPWKIILMDHNKERATVGRSSNYIFATIENAKRTEADARLIAAAPDLLEACVRAESAMFHVLSGKGFNSQADIDALLEAITQCRVAIVRAKELEGITCSQSK